MGHYGAGGPWPPLGPPDSECSLQLLEEAYGMVKRQVSEGLEVLKEECRAQARDLEGSVRADADQIATSKNFLSAKIKG